MLQRIVLFVFASTIIFSACTFDVCSSKRMYVNAFDQFMSKVEKGQDKYSDEKWKELDEQFERFSGECFEKFEDKLSKEEKKEIIKHNLKYVVIRVKSELPFDLSQEDQNKVNEILEEVDSEEIAKKLEELKDVFDGFDKDKFEDAMEDFGKGFEKLEKAFEEVGETLKEIFEESNKEKK